MRGRAARSSLSHVVALVAVALLTLAGVRSTVMQAGEARGATPLCVTAPAEGAHSDHAPGKPPGKAHVASCEFCAAAAHAPVCADAPVLPAPTAVAWFTPAPVSALGPRGPPAFRARARAPPHLPTA